MLLAIDAGNTNTTFALFDGERLLGQWRLSTDARRTADEYGVWLTQLMERSGLRPDKIKDAIIACVVPQALFDLSAFCRVYFNAAPLVVGEPQVKLGIGVSLDPNAIAGADRLVNAAAAWNRFKQALIVIDMGTATTFDVVNAEGKFIGGAIAPGVNMAQSALRDGVAHPLPDVPLQPPAKAIGGNTAAAMQSGLYYGYVGLLDGIVGRIRTEFGAPMKVIATGGLSHTLARATPIIDHIEPDLTIMGLRDIFALNRKSA